MRCKNADKGTGCEQRQGRSLTRQYEAMNKWWAKAALEESFRNNKTRKHTAQSDSIGWIRNHNLMTMNDTFRKTWKKNKLDASASVSIAALRYSKLLACLYDSGMPAVSVHVYIADMFANSQHTVWPQYRNLIFWGCLCISGKFKLACSQTPGPRPSVVPPSSHTPTPICSQQLFTFVVYWVFFFPGLRVEHCAVRPNIDPSDLNGGGTAQAGTVGPTCSTGWGGGVWRLCLENRQMMLALGVKLPREGYSMIHYPVVPVATLYRVMDCSIG